MKNKFIILILSLVLSSSFAHARMTKVEAEQGNRYITHLTQLGKDQLNYKEFKSVLESLKRDGYSMMKEVDFYGENVQQLKEAPSKIRNWLEFAIQVNFTGKVFFRDGKRFQKVPVLKAHGMAQEICEAGLVNCSPADVVEFSSYELGWGEIPDLGGGTSSAGSN